MTGCTIAHLSIIFPRLCLNAGAPELTVRPFARGESSMTIESFINGTEGRGRVSSLDRMSGVVESARNLFLDEVLRERRPAREEAPVETTVKWGAQSITLRSEKGINVYFKDGTNEWESKDGTTWIKKGSDGHVSWRGTVRIDDKDNFIEQGTAFGITKTRSTDGRMTRAITTSDGKEVSLTTFADGIREFKGQSTWRSQDGINWTSGSNTWTGELRLDENGILWRERRDLAGSDRWDTPYRSAESQRIKERMQELSDKYKVSFGAAGTEMDYQHSDAETDTTVTLKISLRLPAMAELETLQECLDKYAHLAPRTDNGRDFGGMRYNFISHNGDGKKVGLWGWYHSSKDGIPQIFFGPGNSRMTRGWEALEGTALHEIAHHLQHNRWNGPGGKEVPATVRDFFGWKLDAASGKFRLDDKDGNLWERDQIRMKDTATGKWYYTGRWYPVVNDTVIKEASRARTNRQMFDNIPDDRKPCTQYFTHPQEAHAEAVAMLLHNPRLLSDRNKKLYEATRQWDQADINSRFGVLRQDGKDVPRMMRGADGKIVPNNDDNRKKVQDMHESWKKPGAKTSYIDWRETGRQGCICCV